MVIQFLAIAPQKNTESQIKLLLQVFGKEEKSKNVRFIINIRKSVLQHAIALVI
jgi:hypothetical protein